MTTVTIRCVPGFPGYGASQDGRVWSKLVHGSQRIGEEWHVLKSQLGGRPGPKARYHVSLCRGDEIIQMYVHRIILLTFVGPKPDNLVTRHLNGNGLDNCLDNLCYGTNEENCADQIVHGTDPSGERHGGHKLTEEQVKEIIRLRAEEGIKIADLARQFEISDTAISRILKGETWDYLERPERQVPVRRVRNTNSAKLTEEQVKEIIRLQAEEGVRNKDLAEQFGVSTATVSMIQKGKTWPNLERPERKVPLRKLNLAPAAKITENDVREIRRLHANGRLQRKLAEQFGIAEAMISHIITGKAWSHVV